VDPPDDNVAHPARKVSLVFLRSYWRRLIPLLSIIAYCTLLHAIMHAEARLSDPLRPLLFVIVATGVCAGFARGRLRSLNASALG
jgi:hypothetical protein